MAPSPASLIWSDGRIHTVDDAPADVLVRMGSVLGISPAVHVRPGVLLGTQVRILAIGATALGYTGFEATAVSAALHELDGPSVVALVPSPDSHKAMPPGDSWSVHTEAFAPPPIRSDGLRLATSQYRRNETSPATSIQLWDDTELLAGSVRGDDIDATLWLNLGGHVASVDQHALFALLDGRLVTPSPEHGAVRTAWRQALVIDSGATELALTIEDLRRADGVACLTTWGEVLAVTSLDGRLVAGSDVVVDALAAPLDAPLDAIAERDA